MTVLNTETSVDWVKQPMFFGPELGLQRFDRFKYPQFNTLNDQMLGFFWRPEEVDLTKDKADFAGLSDDQKHIFISNLSYQTLLDSVQGRAPMVSFGRAASLPELEACLVTWEFFENIHSKSYSHIIKNVFPNPKQIFDDVLNIKPIIERTSTITKFYDDFIKAIDEDVFHQGYVRDTEKNRQLLVKALISVYLLEGLRFYASFACTFALAEMKLMEGNAKIIQLILRDELKHFSITQHIINLLREKEGYESTFKVLGEEIKEMFLTAVDEEKAWAEYLFSKGSIIGLNAELLNTYIAWLANKRASAIRMDKVIDNAPTKNPLPWMSHWTQPSKVQVAPQETEITSYLISSVKRDKVDYSGIEL